MKRCLRIDCNMPHTSVQLCRRPSVGKPRLVHHGVTYHVVGVRRDRLILVDGFIERCATNPFSRLRPPVVLVRSRTDHKPCHFRHCNVLFESSFSRKRRPWVRVESKFPAVGSYINNAESRRSLLWAAKFNQCCSHLLRRVKSIYKKDYVN